MAIFVSDSFTGVDTTPLQSRTGEIGATWTEHPNESGTDVTIVSNQAKMASAAAGVSYYASGTPASAEYDVEITAKSTTGLYGYGPAGRISTSAKTYYFAWLSTNVILYKWVAGSLTNLGSAAYTTAVGDKIKLEIRDAAKKVFIDTGSGYVQKISSADNTITAAGKAGLRFYGNGGILDDFVATDLSSSATPRSFAFIIG